MSDECVLITLGNYRGVRVRPISIALTDEAVVARMRELLERVAKDEQVDGPVEEGDVVSVTYEGRVAGKPYPGLTGTARSLKVGSGSFIAGFEERLAGHRAHDCFECTLTFPVHHINEELQGRRAHFRVTLERIMRPQRNLFDDAFVRSVSEFEGVADLRQAVVAQMEAENADEMRRYVREQAKSAVVDASCVEVPDEVVDMQVQANLEEMDRMLCQQGSSLADYQKRQGKTAEEFASEMAAETAKGLACALVLAEVARREGLSASDDDVRQEVERLALATGEEPERIVEALENPGFAADFRTSIVHDKALDFIVEHACIVEGEVSDDAL